MMLKLVLLIGAVSIFAFRTIVFLIGIVRERKKKIRPGAGYEPFVSVVIPARNEEDNITACIRSIAKSRYPKDKFEIIVVNDRSTDRTGDILKELEEVNENLVIKTVTEETAEPNLRGKPGALQAGIDIARGELVLMTDADCTVPEEWIMDMASAYDDEDTGLVAAFSIPEPVRVFDKVQAVYWIYLHAMGSGGFGLNMPLGCIGNNLSVRTKTFREIGG